MFTNTLICLEAGVSGTHRTAAKQGCFAKLISRPQLICRLVGLWTAFQMQSVRFCLLPILFIVFIFSGPFIFFFFLPPCFSSLHPPPPPPHTHTHIRPHPPISPLSVFFAGNSYSVLKADTFSFFFRQNVELISACPVFFWWVSPLGLSRPQLLTLPFAIASVYSWLSGCALTLHPLLSPTTDPVSGNWTSRVSPSLYSSQNCLSTLVFSKRRSTPARLRLPNRPEVTLCGWRGR